MKKYLFFIALIFIYNCTEHKSSSSSRYQDTEYEESEDYDEDEEKLKKKYGNKRGWLDDSHFSPTDISDGTASFTDDRGYEYRVELD